MSAFLGHIHYWLYHKIRIVLAREEQLIAAADRQFPGFGTETMAKIDSKIGSPIPASAELADIIDHNNIHGWLQQQITYVEARETLFIRECLAQKGQDAVAFILETFKAQGAALGAEADLKVDSYESLTGEGLYQVMQNYYLNGMPCDEGDDIYEATATVFSWAGNHRTTRPLWEQLGVPTQVMAVAYKEWLCGFVNAVHDTVLAGGGPTIHFDVDMQSEPFRYTLTFC